MLLSSHDRYLLYGFLEYGFLEHDLRLLLGIAWNFKIKMNK